MRTSYKNNDVTLLLKDITGLIEPQNTEERERLIQSGKHYCEMLPIEYEPTDEYMGIYKELLQNFSRRVSHAVMRLCERVKADYKQDVVLVSLARAGLPTGILMKHYYKDKYGFDAPHYGISIIRGRGIDKNAIRYILERHRGSNIVFVDGWTGKGAIYGQLKEALVDFPEIPLKLAVIADPANVADYFGTREDLIIPSSCLNSTVSGLISRTVLRDDIIRNNDFHGAVYYGELAYKDESYNFIEHIERYFFDDKIEEDREFAFLDSGLDEARNLADYYEIKDINLVKPGIGETTRVLLRRVPWKIIVNSSCVGDIDLRHVYRLAQEKGVPIEYNAEMSHYKCCGLIKELGDV